MQKSIWFYVSLIPPLAAIIGMSLAYTSYAQHWGGGDKIATVISVFFCEIVMVVAGFGALSYMKQEKTAVTKKIVIMNVSIAISAALTGIYIFLS